MARPQQNSDQQRPQQPAPQSNVTRSMRMRAAIVAAVFVLGGFGTLIYNLGVLQFGKYEEYSTRAAAQQLRDEPIEANRGTIYDANMNVLAKSATVWNVVVSPKDMNTAGTDIYMVAKKLAEILELEVEPVVEKLSKSESNYQTIKRQVEKPVADEITQWITEYNADENNKKNPIRGITLEQASKRYYPYGDMAATVIGFTNADGDGTIGLEHYYNETLKGTDGRVVSVQNARGEDMQDEEYSTVYEAQDGNSLVLSIDENIQQSLETHLSAAITEYGVQNRGAGIVMNVNTGEILAMAVEPSYDLNDPFTITDPVILEELAAITDEEERAQAQTNALWQRVWRNKAVSDTNYPGSVYKMITAAAALDSGAVDTSQTFNCTGALEVAKGVTMHCAELSGHGTLDFYGGLDSSCNPYFIQMAWKMGTDVFCDYLQAFGFLERTGIDMDDESLTQTVSRENMGVVELSSSVYGQTTSMTPIALITAACAVVNGGKLLEPHVVKQILDADGNVVENIEPVIKRQVISEDVSNTICAMLENSVKEGHGKNAYVAGYHVGGKSGTSQKNQGIGVGDEEEEQKYISSFLGFAPADDPQIAVLVLLDTPTLVTNYGGKNAAFVVANTINDSLPYLGVEREYSEEEQAMAEVSVPAVVGMDSASAQVKMNQTGLNFVVRGSGSTVTYQYPAGGTAIARQSTIVLYTDEGAGPSLVKVPNVVGQSYDTAMRVLQQAGLNMQAKGALVDSASVQCSAQSVAEGTEVEEGTIIEVTFMDTTNYSD